MKNSTALTTVVCVCLPISVMICVSHGEESHQPYSSYWHFEELLKWNPKNDPHVPFNISMTPIAKRFAHASTQRNPSLSTKPQIMTLVGAHPTSNHPSQGFRDVTQYAFPFWQYVDAFVMWGGSADEGLVVPPSAPWIDAAHRNGVEIYGTVFLPPKQYGGKLVWVKQLLSQDADGNFPVADKLIEVATLYGFDGWFLNQESQGLTPSDALSMQQFLEYYQRQAAGKLRAHPRTSIDVSSGQESLEGPAVLRPAVKMIWYDSMIDDGSIDWQEELNDRNAMYFQAGQKRISDRMFLDFGWDRSKLVNTARHAKALGRSPWELFAGIDIQSHCYRTPVDWPALYAAGKPDQTSVALYWPNSTSRIAENKFPEVVYEEEQRFWNGCQFNDPEHGAVNWEGFADYFPARSVIQEFPFITRFNYGLGRFYYERGNRLSEEPWHNLSNQDILPTWQWDTDLAKLKPSFNFVEAYNGGSSLRIEATLEKNETAYLPLYKTKLRISPATIARVVAKSTTKDIALSLAFTFVDDEEVPVVVDLRNFEPDQWNLSNCKLQTYAGKTVAKVGLNITAHRDLVKQAILVGELALINNKPDPPAAPKVSIKPFFSDNLAELYLQISGDSTRSIWYHDIYQIQLDGSKKWLGRATGENYYVPEVQHQPRLPFCEIAVESVSEGGAKSNSTVIRIDWPASSL